MRTYSTTGYKRRQYEDVARILGEQLRVIRAQNGNDLAVLEIVADFVRLFSADNGRFDESRFRARINEYITGGRK